MRTIDHVRAEAESVDRERPSFLRSPERPTLAEAPTSTTRGRMPTLGQPTRADYEELKLVLVGAFLGMLLTLIAQRVLP